ncbi:hypothetical protein AB0N17_13285 [Streptomyces sp. NPDC051133]|uniref:hypothetical protein n=1 Tax=Streptomyces sp. NPDC051133 TaxID=3155521 RepID=UPI003414BB9B
MLKIHRSTAVTAGIAAAAALVASGITYASASPSGATRAPSVIAGGTGTAPVVTDPGSASKGNEGVAVVGGITQPRQGERREHREHHEEGRIQINERSYSSHPGECVAVVLRFPATGMNIFNDSHRDVDVFSGDVCDNGAPIAHVGPDDTSYNVIAQNPGDGNCVPTPMTPCLASFRVVHKRDHGDDHGGDHDDKD